MAKAFIYWMAAVATGIAASSRIDDGPRCEPIKIDMCKSIGYNMTGMPNLARNKLQTDAMFDLGAYSLLILLGCAGELQFFLCSVYAPMCVDQDSRTNPVPQTLIGPCRPLCERVKRGCLGFFKDFNMKWPEVLECDKFPATNIHDHMCMEGPGKSASPPPPLTSSLMNTMQANPFLINEVRRQLKKGIKRTDKYKVYKRFFDLFEDVPEKCADFRNPEKYEYLERIEGCVRKCSANVSFTKEDKEFSTYWIVVLSVLSLSLSFVSFVTLLVDDCGAARSWSLVGFATRGPPTFLTFCCCMYSVGLLVSQLLPEFCVEEEEGVRLAAVEGNGDRGCVVVFVLTYFFGIAASGWWTVAAASWLASVAGTSRRGREVSSASHAAVWFPAAALTVTAIVARQVQPDELSSVCLPGGATKDSAILAFVLIPESVHLFLGILFYVTAIVASFVGKTVENGSAELRSRKRIREMAMAKKLRAKMGIFGILYILPKLCYLVTVVYEYAYRSLWLDASQQWLPKMEIFMLRISAQLFIGMSCLWWIWRKDVVASWGNCCYGLSRVWRSSSKVETPAPNFYPNYPYQTQTQVDPNNITVIQDASYQS